MEVVEREKTVQGKSRLVDKFERKCLRAQLVGDRKMRRILLRDLLKTIVKRRGAGGGREGEEKVEDGGSEEVEERRRGVGGGGGRGGGRSWPQSRDVNENNSEVSKGVIPRALIQREDDSKPSIPRLPRVSFETPPRNLRDGKRNLPGGGLRCILDGEPKVDGADALRQAASVDARRPLIYWPQARYRNVCAGNAATTGASFADEYAGQRATIYERLTHRRNPSYPKTRSGRRKSSPLSPPARTRFPDDAWRVSTPDPSSTTFFRANPSSTADESSAFVNHIECVDFICEACGYSGNCVCGLALISPKSVRRIRDSATRSIASPPSDFQSIARSVGSGSLPRGSSVTGGLPPPYPPRRSPVSRNGLRSSEAPKIFYDVAGVREKSAQLQEKPLLTPEEKPVLMEENPTGTAPEQKEEASAKSGGVNSVGNSRSMSSPPGGGGGDGVGSDSGGGGKFDGNFAGDAQEVASMDRKDAAIVGDAQFGGEYDLGKPDNGGDEGERQDVENVPQTWEKRASENSAVNRGENVDIAGNSNVHNENVRTPNHGKTVRWVKDGKSDRFGDRSGNAGYGATTTSARGQSKRKPTVVFLPKESGMKGKERGRKGNRTNNAGAEGDEKEEGAKTEEVGEEDERGEEVEGEKTREGEFEEEEEEKKKKERPTRRRSASSIRRGRRHASVEDSILPNGNPTSILDASCRRHDGLLHAGLMHPSPYVDVEAAGETHTPHLHNLVNACAEDTPSTLTTTRGSGQSGKGESHLHRLVGDPTPSADAWTRKGRGERNNRLCEVCGCLPCVCCLRCFSSPCLCPGGDQLAPPCCPFCFLAHCRCRGAGGGERGGGRSSTTNTWEEMEKSETELMSRLWNLVKNQSIRSKSASVRISRMNRLYQSRLGCGASKSGDFNKLIKEKSKLEEEKERLEEERKKMRAILAKCDC